MDELGDYVYARSKSVLTGSQLAGGSITYSFTGSAQTADGVAIATDLLTFLGDDEGVPVTIPGFAGGLVITDRQQVVDSMRGAPWDDFELADQRVTRLGDDAAVVSYRGRATRGNEPYEALFNSTYHRRDGSWRLVVHQQTPV